MKGLPFVIAATAALLTVSACDSHKTQQATSQATTTSASEPTLEEQADRYLAIIKPANEAAARFSAETAKWQSVTVTPKEFDSIVKPFAYAIEAANAALLRADWSPPVRADIRSLVDASASEVADLSTAFKAADAGAQVARDMAASRRAANVVRAELGLPPAKPFNRSGAHL